MNHSADNFNRFQMIKNVLVKYSHVVSSNGMIPCQYLNINKADKMQATIINEDNIRFPALELIPSYNAPKVIAKSGRDSTKGL